MLAFARLKFRPRLTAVTGRLQRGFTLLEILVVVVIISILISLTVISLDFGEGETGKEEAQRFAALIKLASQEAILRSRELAIEVAHDGYQFLILEQQEWFALQDEIFKSHQLPENMRFAVNLEGLEVDIFQQVDEETGEVQETPPRIYLFSSGEMTTFDITLVIEQSDVSYQINNNTSGKLSFNVMQ